VPRQVGETTSRCGDLAPTLPTREIADREPAFTRHQLEQEIEAHSTKWPIGLGRPLELRNGEGLVPDDDLTDRVAVVVGAWTRLTIDELDVTTNCRPARFVQEGKCVIDI
jgi:hypothetical protein